MPWAPSKDAPAAATKTGWGPV
ncbi:hypothetical protein PMI01_00943, partial [Caulobacter sp. AP07]